MGNVRRNFMLVTIGALRVKTSRAKIRRVRLSLRASSPIWASEASLAPRSRVLARLALLAQTGELARRLGATWERGALPSFRAFFAFPFYTFLLNNFSPLCWSPEQATLHPKLVSILFRVSGVGNC